MGEGRKEASRIWEGRRGDSVIRTGKKEGLWNHGRGEGMTLE